MRRRLKRQALAMLSRTLIELAVIASALIGCAVHSEQSGEHSELIQVDRAQVVGFFPKIKDDQIEAGQGTQSALEHIGYALEDMKKCLRKLGVPVRLVRADTIIFDGGGPRPVVLDLRELTNESFGCALAAPNREPRIVRASAGASSLIVLCPAAASSYFSVPECCPEGWKCCSDGTVVGEEYRCPG